MKYKVSHKKYTVNVWRTRRIQQTLKEHPTWKVLLSKEYLGWGHDFPVYHEYFYDPEEWKEVEEAIKKLHDKIDKERMN